MPLTRQTVVTNTGDIIEQSVTDEGIVIVHKITHPKDPFADKLASHGGAGTVEMLDVVNILEKSGITCYMVGIGALRYYGAGRVFDKWEVCVPTEDLQKATDVLLSHSDGQAYEPCPHVNVQLYSLHHTFPFLKLKRVWLRFYLVPSDACHIECTSSDIERSKMGLPYPKLNIFAQSLLDTMSDVPLTDLVDGMDLDNDWAAKNLNLCGTQDIAWAKRINDKITASLPHSFAAIFRTEPCSIREFWEEIVETKESRIGPEFPAGFLKTRFRMAGDGDPRLQDRTIV